MTRSGFHPRCPTNTNAQTPVHTAPRPTRLQTKSTIAPRPRASAEKLEKHGDGRANCCCDRADYGAEGDNDDPVESRAKGAREQTRDETGDCSDDRSSGQ